jgi:hypothetical protein
MKYQAIILLLPVMALFGFLGNDIDTSQQLDDADTEALFKAKYLYEFAVSSDWPDESKKGPFVIAVYGSPNLFLELSDRYATKPVGSQKLEVIQVMDKAEIPDCQILCMSRGVTADLPGISQQLKGTNTMLVTHIEGPAKPGVTINFVIEDSKIRFALNMKEANKRKIVIGSKLIQWAIKS